MPETERVDSLFLDEFQGHAKKSRGCLCSSDAPDATCNVGVALWKVAHQVPWEDRKAGRRLSMACL